MPEFDALIIGGGPAGSAVGAILARAGRRALIVEQEPFPRFHIGESLLPASTPIFRRLGVLDQMHKSFLVKPGGKWFVGSGAWVGDFSQCEPRASFADCSYAFCVERSRFDKILLDNAVKCGAELLQPARVTEIETGDSVKVQIVSSNEVKREIEAGFLFDCSGRSAVMARRSGALQATDLGRFALYSYYRALPKDQELKNGWFVGQMVNDGWCWAIPLERDKISVGLVFNAEDFYSSKNPEERYFLEILERSGFLERVFEPGFERIESVLKTANIGYTSRELYGKGWVAAGDAGFFVDPCFSSGVHLALKSAELAAAAFLGSGTFEDYVEELRQEELSVTQMVKHFYTVSRFPRLQKISSRIENRAGQIKFNTFVGGDFNLDPDFARNAYERVARVAAMASRS